MSARGRRPPTGSIESDHQERAGKPNSDGSTGWKKRLKGEGTSEAELLQEIEKVLDRKVQTGSAEDENTSECLISEKEWLSLDEASLYVGAMKTTLQRWCQNGLPDREVNGRVYVCREDLNDYIDAKGETDF